MFAYAIQWLLADGELGYYLHPFSIVKWIEHGKIVDSYYASHIQLYFCNYRSNWDDFLVVIKFVIS
jgi:hypothetical protein